MERIHAIPGVGRTPHGAIDVSTFRRVGREYAAQVIAFLVAIADRLFIPAVLIRYLGVAEFSAWSIAIATGAFVSVLEFGLTRYYSNRLIFLVERGEIAEAQQTYRIATTLIAAFVLLALLLITLAYPVLVDGVGDPVVDRQLPWIVAPLTLAAGVLQLIALRQALYRAHRHFTAETMVRLVGEIGRIAAVVAVAWLGAGLLVTSWVWLGATLLFIVVPIGVHTQRRYGHFREGMALPAGGERRAAWRVSPGLWLQSMSTTLFAAVPVIVIGTMTASAILISQFVLMRTIANFVRQVQQMFSNLFAIELARRAAAEDHDGHAQVFAEANRLLGIQAAVASAILLVLGQELFALWTGRTEMFDRQMLLLAIAPPLLVPASMLSIEALAYANKPWPVVRARLAQLGITVCAFLILPVSDVAMRMMAALAIGELAGLGVPLIFAVHRLNASISKWSIVGLTIAVIATSIAATGLLQGIKSISATNLAVQFVVTFVAGGVLALSASYWLGLSAGRRQQLREVLWRRNAA